MSRTNPTTAEVTALDKEIQEGQTFANRYGDGQFRPKGHRQIRIVDKKAGNVFTYVTTAHANESIVGRAGVMTTENLLRHFEKIGG